MTPGAPFISMRVVYDDDDLIEVESRPSVSGWAATATAYASAQKTAEGARGLRDWVSQPTQTFTLEVGEDNANGCACLRFSLIDKAGHVVCHLRLATMSGGKESRPEETWRLSLEMRTEPALIEKFAAALETMAVNRGGEAVLLGVLR